MLEFQTQPLHVSRPLLAKVGQDSAVLPPHRRLVVLGPDDIGSAATLEASDIIATHLSSSDLPGPLHAGDRTILCGLPSDVSLCCGDIVLVSDTGRLQVLYRRGSRENTLFVTGLCNSRCVMCSEPPGRMGHEFDLARSVVNLIDPDCDLLGITGGEPTLQEQSLLDLLRLIRDQLPLTSVHMLTNGRKFADPSLAKQVAEVRPSALCVGIPLYSDNPYDHDEVVGVQGAFCETVLGIQRMAQHRIPVEIRTVMTRQVVKRLLPWCEFVWRNFPFACHVAIMGMEPIGLAWDNRATVWIDPADYQDELEKAVEFLSTRGFTVSIYNEQLCVLRPVLWKYARKSISEWKRFYLPPCSACSVRSQCGGLFSSAARLHSRAIEPIP